MVEGVAPSRTRAARRGVQLSRDFPWQKPDDPFTVEVLDGEKAWLKARTGGVGGSEASALWGVSIYDSPYSLYMKKTGEAPEPDQEETEWTELGHVLEDPIAQLYAKRTGHVVHDPGRTTILRSKAHPFMTVSLDRVIEAQQKALGVLEVKNRNAWSARDWDAVGAPLDVQLQTQHAMAVTGYRWGDIAVLHGGNRFRFIGVDFDEELVVMHVQKCLTFWEAMQAGKPPEIDAHPATTDAIKRRFSVDAGTTIELGVEAIEWHAVQSLRQKQIDELEKERSLARNQLRAAMGEARFARLPSGHVYELRPIKEGVVKEHVRAARRDLFLLKEKAKK